MWNLNQVKSQIRQLLLFYDVFPSQRILRDILFFPLEYHSHLGRAVYPWAINLLVTAECNLNCEMCNFSYFSKLYQSEEELDFNNIKVFIEHESKNRPHIFLSGGEPFLREDILDIVKVIKMNGLTCGICTNGVLLDEFKIKKLIKLKVEYIIFSLQGPKKIHDAITGFSGAFDKLSQNIRLLISFKNKNKMKIILNCAVIKSNLNHLQDVAKIAEELKVDLLRFEHLNFLTKQEVEAHKRLFKAEFTNDETSLSSYFADLEIYDGVYYDCISQMQKLKGRFRTPIYFKPFLDNSELRSWYSNNFNIYRRCVFIWKSLFICPNGDIIPCQFLIYKLGNIKTDSIEQIWNSKRYRELRVKLRKSLLPGCSRCCKF
jgi:MoaA/NifB/PqqE/SkfB family radical SAM enzyme